MREDWLREQLKNRQPALAGISRTSAVLVLLAGDSVVLEVRSRSLRRQPGEVCLPGGRMEEGEDAVLCALRETEEELGLPREAIRVLGPMSPRPHNREQLVCPVLAACDESLLAELRPNPAEVERVLKVPLRWLLETEPTPYSYRQENRGLEALPPQIALPLASYPVRREGAYWMYDGACIWGLTGAILRDALKLMREKG